MIMVMGLILHYLHDVCYCGGMVYVMMMGPVLTLLWVMSMVPLVLQTELVLYQGKA